MTKVFLLISLCCLATSIAYGQKKKLKYKEYTKSTGKDASSLTQLEKTKRFYDMNGSIVREEIERYNWSTGNIEAVVTSIYNSDKKEIKTNFDFADKKRNICHYFFYDSKNNLIRTDCYRGDIDKTYTLERCIYNSDNDLQSKTGYDRDGAISDVWEYNYDKAAHTEEIRKTKGFMYSEYFKYNDSGLVLEHRYQSSGPVEYETFTYNGKSQRIEKIWRKGDSHYVETYRYDEKGFKIEEILDAVWSPGDVVKKTIKISYELDGDGRPLKETQWESRNGEMSLTVYEYLYNYY